MTRQEFRESEEYKKCKEKIEGYTPGFTFTLNYKNIPKGKIKALEIVTSDCIREGILESIQIGLALDGSFTNETFKRI